ncbi:MAG: hypothetical protein OEX76_08280 [Candidatus Bathyarchaeota archaeon]|nr:hypothetical protein [Candidatus Bathyarchaeota archaeon]
MDTSAFIAGFDPFSVDEEQYSVPMVRGELASNSLPWVRFNTAIESGRLRVRTPNTRFFNRVKEASKTVGDLRFLSEVDMQVLALALELKTTGRHPLIVTDDYSIQNVANQISVNFTSLMTFGIRFKLHWILYCPACHRKYPPDYKPKRCEVCGTQLKRKPLRKTPVRKQT